MQKVFNSTASVHKCRQKSTADAAMNRLQLFILSTVMLFTQASGPRDKEECVIRWKIAGEFPPVNGEQKSLGFAGPVTGVLNQMLLIAGGSNFPDLMPWNGGKKKYYDDVYILDKKNAQASVVKSGFKLPAAVSYAATCTTPVGIVYAGGENENGATDKVWSLRYDDESTLQHTSLPDLPVPLTNAAMTYHLHQLYLVGGENASGVSDNFYRLDLNNVGKGWQKLPAAPYPVSHAVLSVQSDEDNFSVYLIGGRRKQASGISEVYSSVYSFDLNEMKWARQASLPYTLSAASGVTLRSNHILVIGGDKGTTFHQSETLTAAIKNENDEAKKKKLQHEKIQLQSTHPGFSNELLLYNTVTNQWIKTGSIPFNVPVTTTAVLWDNEIIIPGGEIKAGVRTPLILSGQLIEAK